MLIYLAGLQSVPNDLYEAAEIDGAGFWRKQWNITIPMLRPIIFFVSVISTMGAFKEFTLMLVMTGGGPVNSTTTLVYLVFKEAFEDRKSTRLNSSHVAISYAVFCLKKKNNYI